MLSRERQQTILDMLQRERYVQVRDLTKALDASPSTIRRDLDELWSLGLVRRVRGGAELSATPPPSPLSFESRTAVNHDTKVRIASAAAGLCRPGQTVMIDGGTTTYHMCQALADRQLQVITNSFAIASHLVEHSQCSVIVPGGRVFRDSRLILDPFHSESFLDYRADTLFMGVGGLDETGATNDDALVIRSERDMIARVRDLVVLADSAKFGRNAGLFLCSLDRVRVIVSDESLSEDWQAFVREHGIDLVLV